MRRKSMSRRKSKKVFKRGLSTHRKNLPGGARGGVRF